MLWFGKKQKKYLGVDIGASSIKMVELEKQDERYRLKNYSIVYLGKLARVPHRKDSDFFEKKADLIKKAMDRAGIKAKKAGFSVPVHSSFTTVINFPAEMSKEEIASSVRYEAKKYIPVSVSEVALDWSLIPSSGKGDTNKVLLVAVPKDTIEQYSLTAKRAGLKIGSIEEESFPLVEALVGNDKSSLVLVDWGFWSVNVVIVDEGYVRSVHNLEKGGLRVTRAISESANISLEKAEDEKLKLSRNSSSGRFKEVINKQLEDMVYEVKKIIDSYQDEKGKKIEKCILSGGGARLAGAVDYFNHKLQLDVSVGDPFARIDYSSELKPVIKNIGPSLAVAAGLARKG